MSCEKYAHIIFYGPRNFKIRSFGKILNLKLCHDRLIDAFSLDVNSFQDTLKITSKSGIFDESSEYSVKNMLVEYSTSLKISKFDFFETI